MTPNISSDLSWWLVRTESVMRLRNEICDRLSQGGGVAFLVRSSASRSIREIIEGCGEQHGGRVQVVFEPRTEMELFALVEEWRDSQFAERLAISWFSPLRTEALYFVLVHLAAEGIWLRPFDVGLEGYTNRDRWWERLSAVERQFRRSLDLDFYHASFGESGNLKALRRVSSLVGRAGVGRLALRSLVMAISILRWGWAGFKTQEYVRPYYKMRALGCRVLVYAQWKVLNGARWRIYHWTCQTRWRLAVLRQVLLREFQYLLEIFQPGGLDRYLFRLAPRIYPLIARPFKKVYYFVEYQLQKRWIRQRRFR